MQNKKKNKPMSILMVLGLCSLIFAGPNKGASVAVDFNTSTIDVVTEAQVVAKGDTYTFAVVAKDISDLHSYSVKIRFNDKVLKFKEAEKKLSSRGDCFIETAGGKLLTFLVNPKDNTVEIAATLKGKAKDNTVDGTGALGFFSFEGITDGPANIEIVEVKLLDSDGALDKFTSQKAKSMSYEAEGVVSYESE